MHSLSVSGNRHLDRRCHSQVLRRLDNIDEGVRQFFLPASKLVLESGDPEDALSRALAALSGLVEVPKPRRCTSSSSRYGGLLPAYDVTC